jgi:hypothetical protein
MAPDAKLYFVLVDDLEAQHVAPQAVHAALAFGAAYPVTTAVWMATSNTVAILTAPAEVLDQILYRAAFDHLEFVTFHEPDMGGRLTAAAFEPGERGRKLCRGLTPILKPL